MYQCYSQKDGIFQILPFEKDNKPDGFIRSIASFLKYELINGIIVEYNPERKSNPNYYNSPIISSTFEISYEGHTLEVKKGLTPVNVVELMNHYAKMSKSDIEDLADQVHKKVKTELQNDIEKLQNERADLEAKVETLKLVIRKKEELNQLIKELD